MYVNRTKKNPYTKQTVFDVLSAVAGIAVIGVGVFSFTDPDKYADLFPVIFFIAAVFQCLVAVPRVSGGYGKKDGRKKAFGVFMFLVAGLLILLSVISAICLWR